MVNLRNLTKNLSILLYSSHPYTLKYMYIFLIDVIKILICLKCNNIEFILGDI